MLRILYTYQKGTKRPKQVKNSFTSAISEIKLLQQAPDRNWVQVTGKSPRPESGVMVYLTVHNTTIRGFWDKSAKRFKDIYGVPLEDVTAWYREPKPYRLFAERQKGWTQGKK